jgi:hypothetical protein
VAEPVTPAPAEVAPGEDVRVLDGTTPEGERGIVVHKRETSENERRG